MSARPLPPPVNPALLQARQAASQEPGEPGGRPDHPLRRVDAVVYIHVIWFGSWIGFRVEHYPFGLLTMIVSLEAIFVSTFVMISQNRANEKRQAPADQQWRTVKEEEQQNEDLLQVSSQILQLTKAIHAMTAARAPADPTQPDGGQ